MNNTKDILDTLPELTIVFQNEQQLNMFQRWLINIGEQQFYDFMLDNNTQSAHFTLESNYKIIQQEIEYES